METYNVVYNNVVVALLGEELDREASHITNGVRTALLATSGAKAEEHGGLLANAMKCCWEFHWGIEICGAHRICLTN